MRFLSTTILAVLLFSTSLNFCAFNPVLGNNNETKIAIDVCKSNTSIIANHIDNLLVEEKPVTVILEKQTISYVPVVFSLITYISEPPDRPPRV